MKTFPPQRPWAFTLIELSAIIVIVGILVALLLPMLSRARARSPRIACINNLKQIGSAFRSWSDDYGSAYPPSVSIKNGGSKEYVASGDAFRHFQCMSNKLSSPTILVCPADTRKPAQNFATLENANVSYFVGVDANETIPQMFLFGDRNLAINGIPVTPGLVTLKASDTISWTDELHKGQGNVGMVDGSAQELTSRGFQQSNVNTGTNLNRLAVP